MDDARIAGDYEHATGRQIIDHFRQLDYTPTEVPMIVVGSHGPFTWGESVEKAVYHAGILEEVARMAYHTRQIDPDAPLTEG